MVSSLTIEEQEHLYSRMLELLKNSSKLIKDNYDGTADKFFTPIMIKNALSEALGFICDYIFRPDRYVLMNPTIQYIWKDLVIDLLTARYNLENTDNSGSGGTFVIDPNNVSELKQGDTTVKLSSNDGVGATGHTLNLDDTFKNYKARLNRYRRPI